MILSLAEAQAQLTDLVRLAEAGEEVILTQHDREVARLVPSRPGATRETKARLIQSVRAEARRHASPGPDAARSQDFLYDDDGLPA